MPDGKSLNWFRIIAAALAAEVLPILALVAVVCVYAMVRKPGSMTPEEFAPAAGNWVGPIGGFIATFSSRGGRPHAPAIAPWGMEWR